MTTYEVDPPLASCASDSLELLYDNDAISLYFEVLNSALPQDCSGQIKDLDIQSQWHNIEHRIRCCTIPKPHRNFGGSFMLNFTDSNSEIILNSRENHHRKIEFDINCLSFIKVALEKLPHIRRQLILTVTNSLYEDEFEYRYIEYSIRNNVRYYSLISLVKENYLDLIIKLARGASTFETLSLSLVNSFNTSLEEAQLFISELISCQFLVSQLEPCLTKNDPLTQIINSLRGMKGVENELEVLKNAKRSLRGERSFEKIRHQFANESLFKNITPYLSESKVEFSVNSNLINRKLVKEIATQAEELMILSRPFQITGIENFKSLYKKQYDVCETPLSIILDSHLGIGYGNFNIRSDNKEFVSDLLIPDSRENKNSNEKWDDLDELVLSKYMDFRDCDADYIEIHEKDLKRMELLRKPRLPKYMFLSGSLMKQNNLIDDKNFMFSIASFSEPTVLNPFISLPKQFRDFDSVKRGYDDDNYSNVIYAEFIHLPQCDHYQAINDRVRLKYEIPFVAKSGTSKSNQIKIDDLLVSVQNDEIILRSIKYNKRVVPRITVSSEFGTESNSVYKFLFDLQLAGSVSVVWDWNKLEFLKYLPRVIYKNLILRKARWKITESDILKLPEKANVNMFFREFRDKHKLPRKVVIVEAGELLIDFESESNLHLLLTVLDKNHTVTLEEWLLSSDNCIITDVVNNAYSSEIVIPLKHKFVMPPNEKYKFPSLEVPIKFLPNSEWLFFKVFGNHSTLNSLIIENFRPFIEQLSIENLFDKFFFYRYFDSNPHIRFYFKNPDEYLQFKLQRIFIKFVQPLVNTNSVRNVTIETYFREINRYGSDLITESESIFHNDSLTVLKLLKIIKSNPGGRLLTIIYILRSIDMTLNDFKLSHNDKISLVESLYSHFFKHFGGSPSLENELSEKYVRNKDIIFSIMNSSNDNFNNIQDGIQALEIRSELNTTVIKEIFKKLSKNQHKQRIFDLLPNYLHMFINRILNSYHQKHELIAYYFLKRYYTSTASLNPALTSKI